MARGARAWMSVLAVRLLPVLIPRTAIAMSSAACAPARTGGSEWSASTAEPRLATDEEVRSVAVLLNPHRLPQRLRTMGRALATTRSTCRPATSATMLRAGLAPLPADLFVRMCGLALIDATVQCQQDMQRTRNVRHGRELSLHARCFCCCFSASIVVNAQLVGIDVRSCRGCAPAEKC